MNFEKSLLFNDSGPLKKKTNSLYFLKELSLINFTINSSIYLLNLR